MVRYCNIQCRSCTFNFLLDYKFVNLQLNSKIHQENMADFIIPPYDLYGIFVSVAVQYLAYTMPQSRAPWVTQRQAAILWIAPPAVITNIQPVEKRRPMLIAARRQREMMVILRVRDDLNGETAIKWLNVWRRWDGPQQRPATAVSNKCCCEYKWQHPGVDGYPMGRHVADIDDILLFLLVCAFCSYSMTTAYKSTYYTVWSVWIAV